jgi:hypothetical protein
MDWSGAQARWRALFSRDVHIQIGMGAAQFFDLCLSLAVSKWPRAINEKKSASRNEAEYAARNEDQDFIRHYQYPLRESSK